MSNPIEILLVEDNPADIRLTQEAFATNKIYNKLYVVTDGSQALDFLNRRHEFASAPKPDVVLLDLNLPKVHGLDVLRDMKADVSLRKIPVICLTTSNNDQDIDKAYGLGVNAYVQKPVDFQQFVQALEAIETFWLSIVKLAP